MLQAHLVAATTADFLSLMLNEVKTCYCLSQQQLTTTSGLPVRADGWAFFLYRRVHFQYSDYYFRQHPCF